MPITQLDHYVRSSVPEPYRLLGVRLRSFSLGHIFLMQRFDCKFGSDDPEATGSLMDVFLGIAICSRTYEEFLDFINDGKEFNKWCQKWGKAIRYMVKHDKKFDMFETIQMFKEYMRDGVHIPKYWESNDDNERPSGAHWSQNILVTLMSELGYTQSEALNMPLSQAIAQYYKFAENSGAVTLMTDLEIEMVEAQEKPVVEEVSNG